MKPQEKKNSHESLSSVFLLFFSSRTILGSTSGHQIRTDKGLWPVQILETDKKLKQYILLFF